MGNRIMEKGERWISQNGVRLGGNGKNGLFGLESRGTHQKYMHMGKDSVAGK